MKRVCCVVVWFWLTLSAFGLLIGWRWEHRRSSAHGGRLVLVRGRQADVPAAAGMPPVLPPVPCNSSSRAASEAPHVPMFRFVASAILVASRLTQRRIHPTTAVPVCFYLADVCLLPTRPPTKPIFSCFFDHENRKPAVFCWGRHGRRYRCRPFLRPPPPPPPHPLLTKRLAAAAAKSTHRGAGGGTSSVVEN